MPVPAQATLFNESVANGLTTSFPYQFMIADADDITVEVDDIIVTTGFAVTGVGSPTGGAIEFAVAPANGSTVLRYLDPVLKRVQDYQQLGDFNSETIDLDLDRIWLAIQSFQASVGRAIKLPVATNGDQTLMENAAERANMVIGFDLSGNLKLLSPVENPLLAEELASTSDGKGVALVGFKQSGTGAVARTALSKMRETVSVKDFGAIGDGVADDTTAIQNAVNAAMELNGVVYFNGPAVYKITSPITVKVTRDLIEETPGAAQYSDNCAASLIGFGSPIIKASGTLAHMVELVFDTSDSDIAPFYSKVQGLGFDGSNTASIGIKSNDCLGVTYENNRFWNLPVGISYTGYGVFRALFNNFKCSTGIKLSGGGGDSLIFGNDFYAAANSTSGLVFEYYGGNSRVISNVFTNQDGYTTTFAVKLDGTTAPGTEEVRNVNITDNEFCGYTTGIYAVGKGSGTYNVYDCVIMGNHTLPYGGSNPGKLLEAIDCSGFNISNNKFNSISYSSATETSGLALTRTLDFKISENHFENYSNTALRLTDCVRTTVSNNSFYDNGKLGAGYEVVRVGGGSSSRNYFLNNRFYQSSDSYAENGIVELSGANATFAYRNTFLGLNRPYTIVGAASVMKLEDDGTAAPTTGYWNTGDIVWNRLPSAGGAPGWVCVVSGAPGTWKAMPNLAA